MKLKYLILVVIHFFVGIGAVVGGGAAILDPINPLGVPLDTLKYSPFDNFLIPGLILFVIIGIGSLISGIAAWSKSDYQGYYSSASSWALMIWIAVQCLMLKSIVFAHVFFFLIGLAGAVLAIIILYNKRQFPANLLHGSLNNRR